MKRPNTPNRFTLLWTLTVGFCLTINSVQATVCPEPVSIEPCDCTNFENKTNIRCLGTGVNQDTFDLLFRTLREVNNVSSSEWLDLDEFQLGLSNLRQIDFTPFLRTRFDLMNFNHIVSLRSLTGPPLETSQGLIQTRLLSFWYNSIGDEGLGEALNYFSPAMESLIISDNYLGGANETGDDDFEFLPGLSKLVNLKYLDLSLNGIKRLGGGGFKTNSALETLHLYDNRIEEIGENSFFFLDHPTASNASLKINLKSNYFTDATFHVNHGLHSIQRKVTLEFWGNHMDTIFQSKFEKFLESQYQNEMSMMYNNLQCDSRVKWLKDRRDEFESRVGQAACANDEGQTVFTSNLID